MYVHVHEQSNVDVALTLTMKLKENHENVKTEKGEQNYRMADKKV